MHINLSVDPGRGLGVAAWPLDTWDELVYPDEVRVFSPTVAAMPAMYEFDSRDTAMYIAGVRQRILLLDNWVTQKGYQVRHVYFEMPTHMAGGEAAERTNSVVKLSVAAGAVVGWCMSRAAIPCPVAINRWKGTTDKIITKRRVLKRLPEIVLPTADHAWDAVGVGLYVKGFYGD